MGYINIHPSSDDPGQGHKGGWNLSHVAAGTRLGFQTVSGHVQQLAYFLSLDRGRKLKGNPYTLRKMDKLCMCGSGPNLRQNRTKASDIASPSQVLCNIKVYIIAYYGKFSQADEIASITPLTFLICCSNHFSVLG